MAGESASALDIASAWSPHSKSLQVRCLGCLCTIAHCLGTVHVAPMHFAALLAAEQEHLLALVISVRCVQDSTVVLDLLKQHCIELLRSKQDAHALGASSLRMIPCKANWTQKQQACLGQHLALH